MVMNICILHGYLLTGTGSNIYVQNIARELTRQGHTVHLICQEPHPENLFFVNSVYVARNTDRSLRKHFERQEAIPYTGHCCVYIPDLEGILPVYVYEAYDGFEVKELHRMSVEEIDDYVDKNSWVVERVIHDHNIDLILSNHTVMQPPIVADACSRCFHSTQTHVMTPHGSALNFSVKRNDALVPYALKGIENAQYCSVVSSHAKQEFESFFSPHIPDIMHKTITIPPGVDLERFKPLGSEQEKRQRLDAVCNGVQSRVRGGRTHRQVLDFWKSAGARSSDSAISELIDDEKGSYNPWSPDADIADKLNSLDLDNNFMVTFLGKYLWTKGIHLLIAATPLVLERHPNTKFVIVGFGQFREVLELLVYALTSGDVDLFYAICQHTSQVFPDAGVENLSFLTAFLQRLRENGKENEYFELAKGLRLDEHIIFTGYMDHENLIDLLPCADINVVPSIFPEAFGMVATEALACGVMPIQANHTGLTDVINVVKVAFRGRFQGLQKLDLDNQIVWKFANNITVFLDYFSRMTNDERSLIRKRCNQIAQDNFGWASIAQQFTALRSNLESSLR